MKAKTISIKWKIFVYLIGFCAILLTFLWIFQTVYLSKFYKLIKKNEISSVIDKVEGMIGDEDIEDQLSDMARDRESCIIVTNSEGDSLYSAEFHFNCVLHYLSPNELKKLYSKVENNGYVYEIETSKHESTDKTERKKRGMGGKAGKEDFNPPAKPASELKAEDSLILAKIVTVDGVNYGIFVCSNITPVDAVTHTIRVQLIFVSILMIILALILSLIISKRVSKSIINLNDSAKEMAKGNFDVKFEGNDYREIYELSETLNNTAKELGRADEMKHDLIANVSHDLRTPLTMITAYSEIMRDIPGENTPENVQVVIDEANRLTTLVNDLLNLSKIQAGVASLETKDYDLTESINGVVERNAKLLEPYGYKVAFEYDRHVYVNADEFKIYQVIYNLLGNAVNYTGEDKRVTISQKVIDDKVRIEVIDTGEGIEPDKLSYVWDRYYKVDKTHKRAVIGTGLGLSIVKNILELHNAKYGVNSQVGKGSTFWFEMKMVNENLSGKE